MINYLFSVYDSKVGEYCPVICAPSKGDMMRSFAEQCNDSNSKLGKYPEDFTLFEVGTFDRVSGEVIVLQTPHPLGKAIEFVKKVN